MQHVAMIMDGNRRWAVNNKLQAVTQGHSAGADAIKIAIAFCLKRGIKILSLYAFSLENFKRSEVEKAFLFDLFAKSLKNNLETFVKRGIRVCFIGDRSYFPEELLPVIVEAEELTKHLEQLRLNFLFCYGAQQEVLSAVRGIAKMVEKGTIRVDDIDESVFRSNLWMGDVPDPDLIIRTGKCARLSNFLMFQAAYSELMFLDCHWPEISEEKLDDCYERFYAVKRNFGE